MRKRNRHKIGIGNVPLTRDGLDDFIATGLRRTKVLSKLNSALLFFCATVILAMTSALLFYQFYNTQIMISKNSWVKVRNLTPTVDVKTRVNGELEYVFVSQGQIVQKGELLGAVRMEDIKLDYLDAQHDFANKIVQLHCLTSLKIKNSTFELPYNAQLLIDQMGVDLDVTEMVESCEKELLQNLITDQAFEETLAALEDQARVLEHVVKISANIERSVDNAHGFEEQKTETVFPFGDDQAALHKEYRDQHFPMMKLAEVQYELRKSRKDYFAKQLRKKEDLNETIKHTTQEIRFLNKRLRKLQKQLEDNFIYANITGTVVGVSLPKAGTYYSAYEKVFELQPIENEFQVAIALDDQDSTQYKIGAPAVVRLKGGQNSLGLIQAKTVAVLRKKNGKLEAILELQGNMKENAKVILSSGYRGEGEQRLPASITTGHKTVWGSINSIVQNAL